MTRRTSISRGTASVGFGYDQANRRTSVTFPNGIMAAAAWHHQKVDRAGRTVEQFFEEAAAFARSKYALALFQGNELPEAERTQIAQRVSRYIGLPAASIAAANLRIDSETFRLFVKTFVAGHSPFDGDEERAQVSQVVHAFVRGDAIPQNEPRTQSLRAMSARSAARR